MSSPKSKIEEKKYGKENRKYFYQGNLLVKFLLAFGIGALLLSYVLKNNSNGLIHPDAGLSLHEYLTKYGYQLENHTVTTEDGYILTIHRIPCERNKVSCGGKRPPVLFMHGLTGSSNDWVKLGPEKSLSLLLADLGYDIWLGNNRGNMWSRKHKKMDPDIDDRFWNYSYHEIGIYDIPAKIDYILAQTNRKNLTYVGHSQGTTAFLVMGSERPEYNDKIMVMNSLSPVTNMGNITSPVFGFLRRYQTYIQKIVSLFNINKVLMEPSEMEKNIIIKPFCFNKYPFLQQFCDYLFIHILGSKTVNQTRIPVFLTNAPAGASFKQFDHYVQGSISGIFRQYDYGEKMNLEVYNQSTPPEYNISRITAPMAIYYSDADNCVNKKDALKLIEELPNVILEYRVPHETFDHIDFVYSEELDTLLNNRVIKLIQSVNKK